MKVAIMQPYLFPYIGYYELMKEVDTFVLLTDVQFARRGWVNRNRLRCQNKDYQWMTIPVKHAPQNTKICDVQIDNTDNWQHQHVRMLDYTYGKLAWEHPLYYAYSRIIPTDNLCDFIVRTIKDTARFLFLRNEFIDSREINRPGPPVERIIDICKKLGAKVYCNLPGGSQLYQPEPFAQAGIELRIMPMTKCENKLSILDVCIGDGVTDV